MRLARAEIPRSYLSEGASCLASERSCCGADCMRLAGSRSALARTRLNYPDSLLAGAFLKNTATCSRYAG
jgi:hypothetical protein